MPEISQDFDSASSSTSLTFDSTGGKATLGSSNPSKVQSRRASCVPRISNVEYPEVTTNYQTPRIPANHLQIPITEEDRSPSQKSMLWAELQKLDAASVLDTPPIKQRVKRVKLGPRNSGPKVTGNSQTRGKMFTRTSSIPSILQDSVCSTGNIFKTESQSQFTVGQGLEVVVKLRKVHSRLFDF